MAHHTGLSVRECLAQLERTPPETLALHEFHKAEVQVRLVKRGTVIGGAED